jgi:hypothetical protein
MSLHAARTAAQPNPSLKAPSVAFPSLEARNNPCAMAAFCGDIAARSKAAIEANFRRRDREDDFGCIGESSASYPVLYSGSRFGAKPAPCGSASFCFAYSAPAGSRFLPKEV